MPRITEFERADYNENEVAPENGSQLADLESQLDSLHEMIDRAYAELYGQTTSGNAECEGPLGITNRLAAMSDRLAEMHGAMAEVCEILRKIERGS